MVRSLIVPLDGSALAERALPFAAHLHRKTGAPLALVRAVGSITTAVVTNASATRIALARQAVELRTARAELATLADNLHADGVAVSTIHVEVRDPAGLVLDVARRDEAELIVMSTHGRSGIGRYVYGSVADEILRRAEVPVLLVPHESEQPWPTDRRLRLLVPLDGSALAQEALDPARTLADALGGDLLLLQVTRPIDASSPLVVRSDAEAGVAEALTYLEAVASTLRTPSLAVASRAVVGQPVATIPRVAHEEDADLIVMATHGSGGLARVVLGSVATGVLQRASVPLLLVRPSALRRPSVGAQTAPEDTLPVRVSAALQVQDIMAAPAAVVEERTTLLEIANLLLDRRIGAVPVVDSQGKLRGIVTESDFTGKERGVPFSVLRAPQVFGEFISAEAIEAIHARARGMTAWEIMSRPVMTAMEDEPVVDVVARMIDRDLHRLPVVRDGVPVGMVTRHDILCLMART